MIADLSNVRSAESAKRWPLTKFGGADLRGDGADVMLLGPRLGESCRVRSRRRRGSQERYNHSLIRSGRASRTWRNTRSHSSSVPLACEGSGKLLRPGTPRIHQARLAARLPSWPPARCPRRADARSGARALRTGEAPRSRTLQPRWSRRHSAHDGLPRPPTTPARLSGTLTLEIGYRIGSARRSERSTLHLRSKRWATVFTTSLNHP